MQFRLCAVNHMGASPWGETLELVGSRYKSFFESGAEAGVGSVGSEAGLDMHHLKKKVKELTEGPEGEDPASPMDPKQTMQDKFNTMGRLKRAKMMEGKVVAFGRAVKDDFDLYGGGKMTALTLTGSTLPAITLPRSQSGEQNAAQMQFERNAEVIRGQMNYPVSMSAAKQALRKVEQDREIVTRLPSSRQSPSPINYLQKVRDDRNKLGLMRYDGDWDGDADVVAGGAGRPRTAPPPSSSVLFEKWAVDEQLV
jgi:hypothetical protein